MRLEDLTPALVRRAVAIYLEIAWPGDEFPRPRVSVRDLEAASTLDQLFARFDPQPARDRGSQKRHMLRLGNRRYPFMKFVVQEYLVDCEYFLSVDTHDDLDVKPDSPDYPGWMELKRYNALLKREIEAAWAREGLPTYGDLRLLAEGIAQVEREGEKRARLLVVDDETEVCKGPGALLRGRGYEVELAFDGAQVLDRLGARSAADLLLLDFSMPEVGRRAGPAPRALRPAHEGPAGAPGDGLHDRLGAHPEGQRGAAQAVPARGPVRDAEPAPREAQSAGRVTVSGPRGLRMALTNTVQPVLRRGILRRPTARSFQPSAPDF
jgi:hypothetical protein